MPRKTGDDASLIPLSVETLEFLQRAADQEYKDWKERNKKRREGLIRGQDGTIEEERKRKVGIFG